MTCAICLTAAQLLSDRLANVDDPLAKRLAPKLVATLDRAIRFCQATLAYGRDVVDVPKLARFGLHSLVDEVMELVRLEAECEIEFINAVASDFEITADREQMFRVVMNLVRNGVQALETVAPEQGPPKRIKAGAWFEDKTAVIEVSDTGPGIPPSARARLFTPFSSSRSGGSGLGLVIAADLVRVHGGTIALISGAGQQGPGATFRVALPQTASSVQ